MEMSLCVKIVRIRGFLCVIFALIRTKYRDVKGKSEYESEFSPNTTEHKPEKNFGFRQFQRSERFLKK